MAQLPIINVSIKTAAIPQLIDLITAGEKAWAEMSGISSPNSGFAEARDDLRNALGALSELDVADIVSIEAEPLTVGPRHPLCTNGCAYARGLDEGDKRCLGSCYLITLAEKEGTLTPPKCTHPRAEWLAMPLDYDGLARKKCPDCGLNWAAALCPEEGS